MKGKFASLTELERLLGDCEWQTQVLTESPLAVLTLPPTTVIVAGSASYSRLRLDAALGSEVAGVDIVRLDKNDYPDVLNSDHYRIHATQDRQRFSLSHDNPQRLWYHHKRYLAELPRPLYEAIPVSQRLAIAAVRVRCDADAMAARTLSAVGQRQG